jgi:hypothetical protein
MNANINRKEEDKKTDNNTITLELSYEESAIMEWALIKVIELINNAQLPDDLYGGQQTGKMVSHLIDKVKNGVSLLNRVASAAKDKNDDLRGTHNLI